jgi:polyhydroxybutyrate depolymerase
MRVHGVTRELLVHMPPHLDRRTMLIVDFHGATSTMQQQDVYSGFDARADTDGFVVATPNGTVIGGVRQWNFLGAPDVDFAIALVRQLVAGACVAPGHVFATGISSGGAMTAALACRASNTFDGFAPVSANFYIPAICDHAAQRPYLIFHGTADPVVPYYGGKVTTNRDGLAVGGAEDNAAKWAKHNGCGAGRITTTLSSEVVRFTWPDCAAPVIMYKIVGGGHTWPGAAISVPLGKTTHQISATDQIIKLFSAA